MKHFTLISLLLLFVSCGEKKSEISEAPAEAVAKPLPETSKGEGAVPVLSFNELEPMLQRTNDTTYVVNFWATWCKPCIKELPYFEKLGAEYANENVKVLLVSLDFPDRLEKQVIPFVKKFGLQSQVVLLDDPDANSWIPKVSEAWSGAIPATIIYNANTRAFYEKSFTYAELEKALKTIL
ncbi:MAG: thioredoxin [Flavobacteriaceae bacterium]|nr:thioredoxin [Flavobacteriaceae bacterium]